MNPEVTSSVEWKIVARDWKLEKKTHLSTACCTHPLQNTGKPASSITRKDLGPNIQRDHGKPTKVPVQVAFDPLSSLDGPDPLSSLENTLSDRNKKETRENISDVESRWEVERNCVFNRYTTTAKLHFPISILKSPELETSLNSPTSPPVTVHGSFLAPSERIKSRLDQLNMLDEGKSGEVSTGMTTDEFFRRVSVLRLELINAWKADQRVKALKIIMQCLKLLEVSRPFHFYPNKFMQITDVLDTLGNFVLERLKKKSDADRALGYGRLQGTCLSAQETARNWFYKVSSIRELLPRIYLEISLLPSYFLFHKGEESEVLQRLTLVIRGISEPLWAAYARMYLCVMGMRVAPFHTEYLMENVKEIIYGLNHDQKKLVNLTIENGNSNSYYHFLSPPLDWILIGLSCSNQLYVLQEVLKLADDSDCFSRRLLVSALVNHSPASFVGPRALQLIRLVADATPFGAEQQNLVMALGANANQVPPPPADLKPLLNAVWSIVSRMTSLNEYLVIVNVWMQFAARQLPSTDVNIILSDIVKHVDCQSSHQSMVYSNLSNVILTSLKHIDDSQVLLSMTNFQTLLTAFQYDLLSVGPTVIRDIFDALMACQRNEKICDIVLVQHLLVFAGGLHDSVNTQTTDDEKRQMATLISSFVVRVHFGDDFEQQLKFYVDVRASCCNLEHVLLVLVQCVCNVTMSVWQHQNGQHTGKTSSFVRACAAFCFITIPSFLNANTRLQLYLLSANVALINGCMGQADACLKAAVRELPELSSSSDCFEATQSCLANLASFLVAVPDPPDVTTPLYLLRGLANAVTAKKGVTDVGNDSFLCVCLIRALSAAAQDCLPYHICNVDGNDILYGGDTSVLQEAEHVCSALLQHVLEHLQNPSSNRPDKKHFAATLDLFWCLVTWAEIGQRSLIDLAMSLWHSMRAHPCTNRQLLNELLHLMSNHANGVNNSSLSQLVQMISK